jgi:serine/threonine protein kinase
VADGCRCPRCGGRATAAPETSGLCPTCLLELALPAPEGPGTDEDDAEAVLPESTYRVLTILGTDDAGTTYLAEQERTRKLVTLHVVRLVAASDEAARLAFRERAAALARLSHPAIQPVVEVRRTASGDACVVAAFVTGPQVVRYCQSPAVGDAERVRLFAEVCDAVAHAHRQGVCHGRLGPDKVVVRPVGQNPPSPVVVGYSVCGGEVPRPDDDLRGLESIARSMGWTGDAPESWASVAALRERVCVAWGVRTGK